MLDYITVEEAAGKWGVSKRRVQILCLDGRVKGAVKHSGVWIIPKDSMKPERFKSGKK